jgi:hypothetical protein
MPTTAKRCPPNWRPGCTCSSAALEPDEGCYVHGWPWSWSCPYCGQFRGRRPCKRCGCDYALQPAPAPREETADET